MSTVAASSKVTVTTILSPVPNVVVLSAPEAFVPLMATFVIIGPAASTTMVLSPAITAGVDTLAAFPAASDKVAPAKSKAVDPAVAVTPPALSKSPSLTV